jgi:hypothetical protein
MTTLSSFKPFNCSVEQHEGYTLSYLVLDLKETKYGVIAELHVENRRKKLHLRYDKKENVFSFCKTTNGVISDFHVSKTSISDFHTSKTSSETQTVSIDNFKYCFTKTDRICLMDVILERYNSTSEQLEIGQSYVLSGGTTVTIFDLVKPTEKGPTGKDFYLGTIDTDNVNRPFVIYAFSKMGKCLSMSNSDYDIVEKKSKVKVYSFTYKKEKEYIHKITFTELERDNIINALQKNNIKYILSEGEL